MADSKVRWINESSLYISAALEMPSSNLIPSPTHIHACTYNPQSHDEGYQLSIDKTTLILENLAILLILNTNKMCKKTERTKTSVGANRPTEIHTTKHIISATTGSFTHVGRYPQLRPQGGSQQYKVAMFVVCSQFLHTEYIITYVHTHVLRVT